MTKSLLLVILSTQLMMSQAIKKESFSIGEKVTLKSDIMNEERQLNVYLPSNYSTDTKEKFDVIYLLDGSEDEDFIHIVGLVQFASFPWVKMLPNTIVVGIANVDRRRDFTFPSRNKTDLESAPTSGHSEKFIQFLTKEVIPYVNKSYRVSSERTIIGQSLGGLLASEILFKQPETFTSFFIISPSLWWDSQSLLEKNLNLSNYTGADSLSIYVAVGKEGEMMENGAKALYKKIEASKTQNVKSVFSYFEDQDHGNILHLAVYDAIVKMSK